MDGIDPLTKLAMKITSAIDDDGLSEDEVMQAVDEGIENSMLADKKPHVGGGPKRPKKQ